MKKLVSTLLFLCVCTVKGFAYDFSATGKDGVTLYYNILDQNKKTVEVTFKTKFEGWAEGDITVPQKVRHDGKTYKVTRIGKLAFYGCDKMTSIQMPNSLVSIEGTAFTHCEALKSVRVPNNVKVLGESAFDCCYGLEQITLGRKIESIGEYTFYKCFKLQGITIPNRVKTIDNKAFMRCKEMTEVVLGKSVSKVGKEAFKECEKLKAITFLSEVAPTMGEEALPEGCQLQKRK